MIPAAQLRNGMALRLEGELFRVDVAEHHAGQGKMGGTVHTRLRNLSTGTFREHRFRLDERLEDLAVEKQSMDFLYSDADNCYFMHPESFEQVSIPRAVIGPAEKFLKPEMRVPVEFYGGQPLSVYFPDVVEIRVAETAPPAHSQQDNTWKSATLENGVEIMVPQFIRSGETIRIDVASSRYMERAKGEGKKAG